MVDPVTGMVMMLGSIGLQFFNNYKNNSKQDEISAKQREFQKAMMDHDFERGKRLQLETAKLNAELEAQFHNDRMKDIEDEYDNFLSQYIKSMAISNWPLNVLPFIMRGESFGSLINGGSKTIAMHCILTPSNCEKFNRDIYQDLDLRLEATMNNHWNSQSSHPVVYYGGAWRNPLAPVNLTDIQLLKTQLKNVPTMVITPYFDEEKVFFRVSLWGMGEDSDFIVVPNNSDDNYVFSNNCYKKGLDYFSKEDEFDDLYKTTLEEFVSYLECMIAFIADKYYWEMYGVSSRIPILLKDNNTNKILLDNSKSYFESLIDSITFSNIENTLPLLRRILPMIKEEKEVLYILVKALNRYRKVQGLLTLNKKDKLRREYCNGFEYFDIPILKFVYSIIDDLTLQVDKYKKYVKYIVDSLVDIQYITLYQYIKTYLELSPSVENETLVIEFDKDEKKSKCYWLSKADSWVECIDVQSQGFLVPKEIKDRQPRKLKIKSGQLSAFLSKIKDECSCNLFFVYLSIETIVEFCKKKCSDIKECELSIDDGNEIDTCKILTCSIIDNSNNSVRYLLYYDELDEILKNSFLSTNIINLQ